MEKIDVKFLSGLNVVECESPRIDKKVTLKFPTVVLSNEW